MSGKPNHALEPTPVGAFSSASRLTSSARRGSACRSPMRLVITSTKVNKDNEGGDFPSLPSFAFVKLGQLPTFFRHSRHPCDPCDPWLNQEEIDTADFTDFTDRKIQPDSVVKLSNQPAAGNAGIASSLTNRHPLPGGPEPER